MSHEHFEGCGHTRTDPIPELGHIWDRLNGTPELTKEISDANQAIKKEEAERSRQENSGSNWFR